MMETKPLSEVPTALTSFPEYISLSARRGVAHSTRVEEEQNVCKTARDIFDVSNYFDFLALNVQIMCGTYLDDLLR